MTQLDPDRDTEIYQANCRSTEFALSIRHDECLAEIGRREVGRFARRCGIKTHELTRTDLDILTFSLMTTEARP